MSRILNLIFMILLFPVMLLSQNKQTEYIYGTLSPLNYSENKLFKDECGAEVEAIKIDFVTKDGSWGYITHINIEWEHNLFFIYKGKRYYINDFGPIKVGCLFTFKADIVLGGKIIENKQFRVSAKSEEPSNFRHGDSFQFDLSNEDKAKYGSKEEALKFLHIRNLEVIHINFNMFEHYLNVDKLLKEEVAKNHTTKKDEEANDDDFWSGKTDILNNSNNTKNSSDIDEDFWSGKTATQEEDDFWSGKTDALEENDFWSGKETSTSNKAKLRPKFVTAGKKYRYGYINSKGEFVIKPQFTVAGSFVNGIAKVEIINKYGPILDDNKPDKSYGAGAILGVIKYYRHVEGIRGYINTKGEWISKEVVNENIWTTYGGE